MVNSSSKQKLVIVGDGEFAEIAYEYFCQDSSYEVVAFAVEKAFISKDSLYNLPVVAFEEIESLFPPLHYQAFVAITFTKLNRVRTRLYLSLKEKGYTCATYISSKAFKWHNVTIGENCFIFENNVLQHHVEIGNNVILWSGNHIGHRAIIKDNCFISSHVVISGYCQIGSNCFIGVNSTFVDKVKIGSDCFIGANCFINKNIEAEKICTPPTSFEISKVNALKYFKV